MAAFSNLSFAFILCNYYFIARSSSQLMLPRKLLDKIRNMHENSDKLVSIEDSMSLYVDISEANKYPSRDDFHLRVFNRNSNITVCDGRMVDHRDNGKFHCSFDARNAHLRHGVNRFEFEVYSIIDGKRFASQRIPDIYLFDHYLHEGYYDNFYNSNNTDVYAAKIIICSLTALSVAFALDIGPAAMSSEINRVVASLISNPQIFLRKYFSNLPGNIFSRSAKLCNTLSISAAATAAATASHSIDFFNHGIVVSTKASRATGSAARIVASTVQTKLSSGLSSFLSLAGKSVIFMIIIFCLNTYLKLSALTV